MNSYDVNCPTCGRSFDMRDGYNTEHTRFCSEDCRSMAAQKEGQVDPQLRTPDSDETGKQQLNDGIWFPTDERRQMR